MNYSKMYIYIKIIIISKQYKNIIYLPNIEDNNN